MASTFSSSMALSAQEKYATRILPDWAESVPDSGASVPASAAAASSASAGGSAAAVSGVSSADSAAAPDDSAPDSAAVSAAREDVSAWPPEPAQAVKEENIVSTNISESIFFIPASFCTAGNGKLPAVLFYGFIIRGAFLNV